jgi:hypothetical protein
MVRFLKVLFLWCLFSVAGLFAVGLGAWVLLAVGVNSLITPFLVLGLASVLPVSLAVADNVLPRAQIITVSPTSVSCPNCGVPLSLGLGAKPNPDSWPFL